MIHRFVSRAKLAVLNWERYFYLLIRDNMGNGCYSQYEPALALDVPEMHSSITSLSNLLHDSLLWAVPKKRRSVEKRMNRKFGWPGQVWKPLVPKKNLLICKSCGDNYEAGCLCPTCYSKINVETKEIHKALDKEIGLNPMNKEIIVLYKEEREEFGNSFKGKRIVEMLKNRPQWFSKNLLEKTSKGLAASSNVKPSDLA